MVTKKNITVTVTEKLPSESKIQQKCVIWYKNCFCLATHPARCLILAILNENQHRLVAIGLYPGASDMLVIHRNTPKESPRVAFIEAKDDSGTQKPNQKKFQAHVEGMGFEYHIIRSLEDFQKIVESWKNQ